MDWSMKIVNLSIQLDILPVYKVAIPKLVNTRNLQNTYYAKLRDKNAKNIIICQLLLLYNLVVATISHKDNNCV